MTGVFRLGMGGAFAALLAFAGCATHPVSASAEAGFERFLAPRLDQIVIDGDTGDWKDHGLSIDVLASTTPGPRDPAAGDAWARVGWDDRGLLVLIYGRDSTYANPGSTAPLWKGSSVDLLLATDDISRDMVQASLTPVSDKGNVIVRTAVRDARQSKSLRATPASVVAGMKGLADRTYVIEALLPWDQLKIRPADGVSVNVQVFVNSVASDGKRTRLIWYPVDGANFNTRRMHTVTLASRASRAIDVSATGVYERFRRLRVEIATLAQYAGKRLEWRDGRHVLGETMLSPAGRLAVGSAVLPLPKVGETFTDLAGYVDGVRLADVEVEDVGRARRQAFESLPFVFSTFVFTGNAFPSAEFENPSFVEDIVGTYRISTTYYDSGFNVVTRPTRSGRYGAIVEATTEAGLKIRRYYTLFRHDKPLPRDAVIGGAPIEWPVEFGIDPGVMSEQSATIAEGTTRALRLSLTRNHDTAIILAGLLEMSAGSGGAPKRLGVWDRNTAWWYALRKSIGDVVPYRYIVRVPSTPAPPGGKWPLLIFLHGLGERGDDLDRVAVNGPLKEIASGRSIPFIVVAPQCPGNEWWGPQKLNEMLDDVLAKYPVNPDRIYLTGLSMGGFGTWAWAAYHPERFAAIAPICGGGDPLDVERIKDLPTWIFHGGKDPTVKVEESYRMVEALRKVKGRVQFTLYPNVGHDSWTETYGNPDLYDWLLRQRRGEPFEPPSTTASTQPTHIAP